MFRVYFASETAQGELTSGRVSAPARRCCSSSVYVQFPFTSGRNHSLSFTRRKLNSGSYFSRVLGYVIEHQGRSQ